MADRPERMQNPANSSITDSSGNKKTKVEFTANLYYNHLYQAAPAAGLLFWRNVYDVAG